MNANVEKLMIKWINGGTVITEESVTDQNCEARITLPLQNSGLKIWVKGERTLAIIKDVGTIETDGVVDVGVLRGGDANDNN